MNNKNFLKVSSYQGKIEQGNYSANVENTLKQLSTATENHVDILCMPESYLHGYFEAKDEAYNHSIDLQSTVYSQFLDTVAPYKDTTLLVGLNEREGDRVYNTVVAIENGQHVGKYRKAYTYPPYDYFTLGNQFPVFNKKGVTYGIMICIDSAYIEPARILALSGAQLLFCPMFNRVPAEAKMLAYLNRKSHFIARAFENECWLVCSDVVWPQDDTGVCSGSAAIIDNKGELMSQTTPFSETQLVYDIPIESLRSSEWLEKWHRRFIGNPELEQKMSAAYASYIKKQGER